MKGFPFVLLVNSGRLKIRPKSNAQRNLGSNKTGCDGGYGNLFPVHHKLSELPHFGEMFLMESLILAQDERWRRA